MPFWTRKKKPEPAKKAMDETKPIPHSFSSMDLPGISQDIINARSELIENRSFQRKAPAVKGVAMDSAINGSLAFTGLDTVNTLALSYYAAANSFIGYQAMSIIAQNPIVSRFCYINVKDAVQKWYELTINDETQLTAEQIKQIEKWDKAYKLKANMVQAGGMNEIFGIRHILFKHTNPDFDYSKPFNPDSWGPGEYAGMAQIDPIWLTPEFESEDLMDPTRIGYYEPTFWIVNGKQYHKSHFVVLMGDEVVDILKPTYRYGGISFTQKVYERLYAADRTANEIPQLVLTKRLVVRFMDLVKAQASKSKLIDVMQAFSNFRDNFGTLIAGKEERVEQHDTTLSELPDTVMTLYTLVCAIRGRPVSDLLGTGHGGLGTGDTDDDYVIRQVEETQENLCTPIAEAHYARLIPTMIKPKMGIEPEIEINWTPIKVMSELEIANVNKVKADTDSVLELMGVISAKDAGKRLIADKDSGHSGMELPEELPPHGGDDDDGLTQEKSDTEVKDQSLNGAQVTSLADIANKVATEQLTLEQGIEIIVTAFPVDRDRAKIILGKGVLNQEAIKDGEL